MEHPDKIITLGKSILQYGPYNQRIYLMHFCKEDQNQVMDWINKQVQKNVLSKVIAKVSQDCSSIFIQKGYRLEAQIPKYYPNGNSVNFVANYFNDLKRKKEPRQEYLSKILAMAKNKFNQLSYVSMDTSFSFRKMKEDDVQSMSRLYRIVFPSYPFPIYDESYLKQTMAEMVDYFGIFYKNDLVALSSIEKSQYDPNAEMTDFATLPIYQKKGLAAYLLHEMEQYAKTMYQFKTIYTIARAYSIGINTIFSKAGYSYGGTLTNNTNIHGQIESMNVWYKAFS
jgi:putative beta-lysine N-acetyltransferase